MKTEYALENVPQNVEENSSSKRQPVFAGLLLHLELAHFLIFQVENIL